MKFPMYLTGDWVYHPSGDEMRAVCQKRLHNDPAMASLLRQTLRVQLQREVFLR
jgi:hypothetical protein